MKVTIKKGALTSKEYNRALRKSSIDLSGRRSNKNKVWEWLIYSLVIFSLVLFMVSRQAMSLEVQKDSEFVLELERVLELEWEETESDIENLVELLQEEVNQVPDVSKTIDNSTFPTQAVKHKEWDILDVRQDYINYAYRMWWKDFLLTILAENGTMWIDRKSNAVWANGYSDYGLCQINVWYHPEILWTTRRFKEWFYNPYKQLDYCWELYSWWTRFYWYDVRHKVEHKLEFYK